MNARRGLARAIIRFAKKIPRNPVNNRLIDQLVGAGTSVGANYCEADDAVSGKEFKQKIGTCRKESKETHVLPPHGGRRGRRVWPPRRERSGAKPKN